LKPKKEPRKEAKDGAVEKLKRRIKRLEKENDKLKSEVRTLEAYRELTDTYVGGKLDGVPVERVIQGVKKKESLRKIKVNKVIVNDACPKCLTQLIKVPFINGVVKICNNCEYRETLKGIENETE
jgi:predicted nuclease with TOPRIM domain